MCRTGFLCCFAFAALAVVVNPAGATLVPRAAASKGAPDALLRAVTTEVTEKLKQGDDTQTNSPSIIAALVEEKLLPLFDFDHMTQLVVARHWRQATPAQQNKLVAEFKTLLVRNYSNALVQYRDQTIVYKPVRTEITKTVVTVKSTLRAPGTRTIHIDYDMAKSLGGWKVYDLRVGGISPITTHQPIFATTIRDEGVDGLIKLLSDQNRQTSARDSPQESSTRPFLFLYTAITSIFRGSR